MLTLGIDPGTTSGACVLLEDGQRVVDWCGYRSLSRKSGRVYKVAYGHWPAERDCESLETLLIAFWGDIRDFGVAVVAVEGIFANPSNPQSSIPLAESAGMALGVFGRLGRVLRPRSASWRGHVLGLKGVNAETAEREAMRRAPALFDWPGNGWADVEKIGKASRGAVAEAACIARWGYDHA